MIDLKILIENFDEVSKKLGYKIADLPLEEVVALDKEVKAQKTQIENLQSQRNQISKQIGEKKRNKEDASSLFEQAAEIGKQLDELTEKIEPLQSKLDHLIATLPNIPDDSVPLKEDASFNECIKTHGTKPEFSFPIKNHVELGESLGLFDFPRGAKIAGSGFAVYKEKGALLEWALINHMWKIQLKHGFTPYIVPHLAKPEALFGVGQLPKFADQLFKIHDDDYNLYLIPTAEAALCSLHQEEILDTETLPRHYFAYTPCFRREAGAAGAQERGLIRTHQFNKVEMFAFAHPDESEASFDKMVACAEEILQSLNIHYKMMLLAAGDMSFSGRKTVDVELWLPGQNRYYECSSISHCGDFQARRAKIRCRTQKEKPMYLHTLNGSGLATSRLMVALLENNQQENGSVLLPEPLQEALHGQSLLPIG